MKIRVPPEVRPGADDDLAVDPHALVLSVGYLLTWLLFLAGLWFWA